MENSFTKAFNKGNDSFAKSCSEPFELLRNGNPGLYTANSIDDLSAASALVPGGRQSVITFTLFVKKDVTDASGLQEGSVLLVRGKKTRVATIHYEGDNCHQIDCTGIMGNK